MAPSADSPTGSEYAIMSDLQIRRSELSTPASSRKMIAGAARGNADLVFLDLEDSVAPSQKVQARQNAVWGIRELDWGDKLVALRINALDTQYAYEDIIEVVEGSHARLDIIIVPKVTSAEDVRWVDRLLTQIETKLELQSSIGIEVLIEDVAAVARLDDIAHASPRLKALIFGPADFGASQGVRFSDFENSTGENPWKYVRQRIVIAARAAGIAAVDGPFEHYLDDASYRELAARAYEMGYSGKWAIHPRQVDVANDVFTTGADTVAQARKVLESYQAALGRGEGAFVMDGKMVDAASIRPLREIVMTDELLVARSRTR